MNTEIAWVHIFTSCFQGIVKSLNVNALPDKGAKIHAKIDQLTEEISRLDLDITAGHQELSKARREAQARQAMQGRVELFGGNMITVKSLI